MIMNNDNINKIPSTGCLIAYIDECVIYANYKVDDNNIIIDSEYENILDKSYECHFFDSNREYRMIRREAREDVIEILLSRDEEDALDRDLLFIEDVLVSNEYLNNDLLPDKIRIVNRYKFSDNDTLTLDNYRIALLENY